MNSNNNIKKNKIVMSNNVIRYHPEKYRSTLEIFRDVLELFLIREKITISTVRLTTNWIKSASLLDTLIEKKFIVKNRNDLPRQRRAAYATYSLTNEGRELLNKIKLLDSIMPFEKLHDIKRYD
jgi:predicted transcriptional regulator